MSEITKDKHEFPCEACGANLKFQPGQNSIQCEYCGHQQKIESVDNLMEIIEYDFEEALNRIPKKKPDEVMEQGHEIRCEMCGAQSIITGHASHCAFCGSPIVVELDSSEEGMIVPESVLPFMIDKTIARDEFKKWVKGLWFAPGDLKKRAKTEGMNGVYLPYWTYDSSTDSAYTGQRGRYYYVTETVTNANGEMESRQVKKIDWSPVSGSVQLGFDDILIVASNSLPRKMIRELEPWDLEKLTSFDPRYLSGFLAEKASIDLKEGFDFARGRMASKILENVRREIGGDEQRVHSVRTTHENVKFKQILLPLWISSFRFKNRAYRIMINARTGEVQGERPWSIAKIAMTIFGGLLGAGLIGLLGSDNGQSLIRMIFGG